MTNHAHNHEERLLELLAEQAGAGLDVSQVEELDALIELAESGEDLEELELAAAAAYQVFDMQAEIELEPMPESLSEKLIAVGEAKIASKSDTADRAPALSFKKHQAQTSSGLHHPAWGWLAAAAVLAISVTAWLAMSVNQTPSGFASQRQQLLTQADDLIRSVWVESDDPVYGQVKGDVVWSDNKQQGYMRLVGMPVNDPDVQQYQLWIVDPDVDSHPVDGGVFDVNEDGEVIVPIDAKLHVNKPTVFAITVEKPGGVVVSAGPLRVVAPVKS